MVEKDKQAKRVTARPRNDSEDEFFLANEIPVDRRQTVQPKLKNKEEKKLAKDNEKKQKVFHDMKNLNDKELQSKEFGDFID